MVRVDITILVECLKYLAFTYCSLISDLYSFLLLIPRDTGDIYSPYATPFQFAHKTDTNFNWIMTTMNAQGTSQIYNPFMPFKGHSARGRESG